MDNATTLTEAVARDTVQYLKGFSGTNDFYNWLATNASTKKQIVKTQYDDQNKKIYY